jgi:outer membrane protein assembly factor BamB
MKTANMPKGVAAIGVALLIVLAYQPSKVASSTEEASVLIDLGYGEYYWADLEIGDNNTAIHAIERAGQIHGLEIEVEWSSFGAWVKSIGDINCTFPKYWHFYNWSFETDSWSYALVGPSDYVLEDGDSVAEYCDRDYRIGTSPYPVPSPVHRYPSIMFRSNLRNTGHALDRAPESGRLEWDYDTGKLEIDSSPAVGYGKVFITGTNGFYAIEQDTGELAWENTDVRGQSSPALYEEKVYVGGADGKVYTLDAESGITISSFLIQPNPVRQSITSSPKIYDRYLYIGTFNETGGNGTIIAIEVDPYWPPSILWEYESPSVYHSSPAISDGVLYIGLAGMAIDNGMSFDPPYGLLALSASNGSLLWMYETDGEIMSSPAVRNDQVFFTSRDGYLYSVKTDGSLDWKEQIGETTSSPALSDGKLFVGTGLLGQPGKLLAYSLDGTLLWQHETEGPIQSSPLSADGKVYFATNDLEGEIYCLDESDGELVWSYKPSPTNYILSSPVVADGELFIASDNGHVYAFSKPVDSGTEPDEDLGALLSWLLLGMVILIVVVAIVVALTIFRRRPE